MSVVFGPWQRGVNCAAMARFLFFLLLFSVPALARKCIPFELAPEHIGETACVTGHVLKVQQTKAGTSFLDFCEDYKTCPFTVIVMRDDLKNVGDVRLLEGKDIEISGKIKKYRGRAEIVLERTAQLFGEAAKLPPLPKTYDVDRHGSFSAGQFDRPRSKHPTHRRTSKPSDGDIDEE